MLSPLPVSLLLVFGAAFLAPWLCGRVRQGAGWWLALAPALAFGFLLVQLPGVADGSNLVFSRDWFSGLGGSMDLKLDGWSALMALLVLGIGTLIVIYTEGYLHGHPQIGRFYLYLLSFMGAMLGLVLSDNLVVLFIFWELTSITSYLLIGFYHEDKASRWKALQALLVTGVGAMAMLAGFVLIARVTGTYQLSEINGFGDLLSGSPYYTAIVILILGGAFTKSAQVPFHFWLPNAMVGPTPVSAYLHSATMVKAGVFLLARLNPALGDTLLWALSLGIAGSLTFLLAVGLGLLQKDLKSILAYTTLGVLGLSTALIGIGSKLAIKAMVLFLFAHALYKATLFMTAGSIDHETGTRDVTRLRGLRGVMPVTAAAAGLAVLSMAGVPPFFGFLGKEVVYETAVGLGGAAMLFLLAAFVGNFAMMALGLNAAVVPFFGQKPGDLPKKPHEAPPAMWFGPVVLAGLGLVFGIFPGIVSGGLVGPAIAAIEGKAVQPLEVKLWHGFNLPLLLSVLTLASGFALYLFRQKLWAAGAGILAAIRPFGAEAMYERVFDGIVWFSKKQTRWIQTGYLRDYVFTIVATTAGFLLWAFLTFGGIGFEWDTGSVNLLMGGLVILMILATLIAVTASHYMTVLAALGTVGFGIALIFAYYSAPDLAITQLLVETLTVVLFMFVIIRLPTLKKLSTRAIRARDALLSGAFGILITLLVIQAVTIQFDRPISDTLAEMSYPEAKGRNVVNVILVDFRALDTLGEITVVAAAALGIAALVASSFKKKRREH